jgi:hypothetical protein
MDYLWLAETSQQPISQTTWLKVPPIHTLKGLLAQADVGSGEKWYNKASYAIYTNRNDSNLAPTFQSQCAAMPSWRLL